MLRIEVPPVTLINENNLLDSFKKSDSKTISYFYQAYLPGVMSYIKNNGGFEEDARDIFQEALMVLFKKAKSGKLILSCTLKTYIFSICRFQWLNSMRKTNRIEALGEKVEIADLGSDFIIELEKAEKYRLLQNHLSKLSITNQQILGLYFKKFTTEEIANELGLSKLYVKKMKYLSKKKLIESIKNDSCYKEY